MTPWFGDSVNSKLEVGEINVYLTPPGDDRVVVFRKCRAACRLYGHQPDRRRRHLDTCQGSSNVYLGTRGKMVFPLVSTNLR